MFVMPDKPQDFVKVITNAMRLFAASIGRTWALSLCGNILIAGSVAALLVFAETDDSSQSVWFGIGLYAVLAMYPVVMASVLVQVDAVANGLPLGFREALRRGISHAVPNSIGAVLFIGLVSIGTILLVLPGIFLFISLSFWWTAVVLDKQNIFPAFGSSRRLVSGAWWRTAIVLASVFGLTTGLTAIQERIVSALQTAYADAWPVTACGLVLATLDFVATPILISAGLVAQRRDLQLRALAGSKPSAPLADGGFQ